MRLETLQKQVEDQQEHICVLRDTISLKDRQADMLHSDVGYEWTPFHRHVLSCQDREDWTKRKQATKIMSTQLSE